MKIHELIATPDKWIQGSLAKKANGVSCFPEDEKAVCWCLLGARDKCYEHDYDEWEKVADKLSDAIGSAAIFNDSHTYSEVLALVKELDV